MTATPTPAAVARAFWNTAETSAATRRSRKTLAYWRTLYPTPGPPFWRSGRYVFYDVDQVMAWLDEQRLNQ